MSKSKTYKQNVEETKKLKLSKDKKAKKIKKELCMTFLLYIRIPCKLSIKINQHNIYTIFTHLYTYNKSYMVFSNILSTINVQPFILVK